MECEPIKSKEHGLIDYGFSAVQMAAPKILGLNEKTVTTYHLLGTGFLAVNSLTDTSVGVKPLIPFKTHQKADIGFLAGLSLLTFYRPIRNDRRSLAFHLGFLALSVTNYLLTDYESGRN